MVSLTWGEAGGDPRVRLRLLKCMSRDLCRPGRTDIPESNRSILFLIRPYAWGSMQSHKPLCKIIMQSRIRIDKCLGKPNMKPKTWLLLITRRTWAPSARQVAVMSENWNLSFPLPLFAHWELFIHWSSTCTKAFLADRGWQSMPSWHSQPYSDCFLLNLIVNKLNFNYVVQILDIMLPYTPLGCYGCRYGHPTGDSAEIPWAGKSGETELNIKARTNSFFTSTRLTDPSK